MEELIEKLKTELIQTFKFEDMPADEIDADMPLFGEGLGLDSIDALELIVMLEKNYGLRIETAEEGKKVFYSVRTMAEYITANQ